MVVTTLLATMNMMQLKYVPNNGMYTILKYIRSNSNLKFLPTRGLSEVIGIIEETVLRNIVRDSKIVTPTIVCM